LKRLEPALPLTLKVQTIKVMDEETPEEGEYGCIGAGIGGGFESTSELHALKFDAAMKTGLTKEVR
jgi:hypothetical protein